MNNDNQSGNFLIYDEECFFCSNYVKLVNLREAVGDITLVNARDAGVADRFNIDLKYLNEGMLLILNGNRYYGAEAVNHIALLSTSNGLFNKINAAVFKSRFISHLFYPLLKLGRKTYLCLAGKKEIG